MSYSIKYQIGDIVKYQIERFSTNESGIDEKKTIIKTGCIGGIVIRPNITKNQNGYDIEYRIGNSIEKCDIYRVVLESDIIEKIN